MADIFISYARADRDKIEKLSQALEAEGWSVWWDRQIASGSEFSLDIERELGLAKAVIVCWSEEGAKSRWVKDEATIAHRTGKLKTISLDGTEPPIGYMQFHSHGMSSWQGGRNEPQFVELKDAIAADIAILDAADPEEAGPEKAAAAEAAAEPKHSIVPPETKGPVVRDITNPKALVGVGAALLLVLVIAVIALRGGGAPTAPGIDNAPWIAVAAIDVPADDPALENLAAGLSEDVASGLSRFFIFAGRSRWVSGRAKQQRALSP